MWDGQKNCRPIHLRPVFLSYKTTPCKSTVWFLYDRHINNKSINSLSLDCNIFFSRHCKTTKLKHCKKSEKCEVYTCPVSFIRCFYKWPLTHKAIIFTERFIEIFCRDPSSSCLTESMKLLLNMFQNRHSFKNKVSLTTEMENINFKYIHVA